MPGRGSLYVHAYRWAAKNRTDGGRWSKACEGLDVCLLGQQASALGVTGEGQGAQTLQVQMALPAGWLEEVLAGNHLRKRCNVDMGTGSCDGRNRFFFFLKHQSTCSTRAGLIPSGKVCSISV